MKVLSRILRFLIFIFTIAVLGAAGFGIYSIVTGGTYGYVALAVLMLPALLKISFNLKGYEYDEYGLDDKGQYRRRLSASEQRQMDMMRIAEIEGVLGQDTIKKMTHQGSKDPDKELGKLTGLMPVKKKVASIAARMEMKANSASSKHMCFLGSPGTGKTTVARIMTGYLYKYKAIKKNKIIEVDGNFLVDSDAALKTELLVRAAMDGVLFIDEAYALHGDAVATLIKQMEDKRDRFILILAGYTEPVKELLDSNPGFRSRIKDYLMFPDYTNDEMFDIFTGMAKDYNFKVSEDCYPDFLTRIDREKMLNSFGNARTVRNVLDDAIDCHALNYKEGLSPEKDRIYPHDIPKEVLVI